MSSGVKGSCNRPKSSKHLRGGTKKKRHKPNNEGQAAYHKKIAARRLKKTKK